MDCLQREFDVSATHLIFLPLGADQNTVVYQVVLKNGTAYFLKLRSGIFNESSVTLPKFLSEQCLKQVILPHETIGGQLWAMLDDYKVIHSPFIEGNTGCDKKLSKKHWFEFGSALRKLHKTVLPSSMLEHVHKESYSPEWREKTQKFLDLVQTFSFEEPLAIDLVSFLIEKRVVITGIVQRANELAEKLQIRNPPLVLCHSDVHAGNVLLGEDDRFYILDWDDPIMAPKERDLMFVGGSRIYRV